MKPLLARLDILIDLMQKYLVQPRRHSSSGARLSSTPETPEPSQPRAAPPQTGTRHRVASCAGCDDFSCCREWRVMDHLPEDAESWMRGHGLFSEGHCSLHPQSKMRRVGDCLECCERVSENNICRRRVSALWPLLSTNSKIDCKQLLRVYAHIAGGEGVVKIARLVNLNPNTVSRIVDFVGRAAVRKSKEATNFNKVAVDETFIGKRKDHRGRRPRKRVYWFATMTEILRDGTCGRTVWKLVKRRDAKTLTEFIEAHIAGSKSVVWSDEHRGYLHLSEICRHAAVCHKKEFKTEAGVHTNNAECVHGVIKTFCKECHHRIGISSRNVRKNVALQCLRFLDHRVSEIERWGYRVQAILQCVKQFHPDPDAEDSMSTMSSDTEPEGPAKEPVQLPLSQPTQKLTKKGQPDKRKKRQEVSDTSSDEEPPRPHPKICPKKRERNTTYDEVLGDVPDPEVEARRIANCKRDGVVDSFEDANLDAAGRKADEADILQSMRPGKYILHLPILMALTKAVCTKRGWRVVDPQKGSYWLNGTHATEIDLPKNAEILWPLHYCHHWILAHLDFKHRKFEVYDSLRGYAVASRKAQLHLVQKVLFQVWGKWIKPHCKHCDQQEAGSNDCGLHAINNGLKLLGDKTVYSRQSLLKEWQTEKKTQQKAEKKKPQKKAAKKSTPKPAKKKSTTKKPAKMSEVEELLSMNSAPYWTTFNRKKKKK